MAEVLGSIPRGTKPSCHITLIDTLHKSTHSENGKYTDLRRGAQLFLTCAYTYKLSPGPEWRTLQHL